MGGKLKNKFVVGCAVPVEIKETLDSIAKERGVCRSDVISEALKRYVKQNGKEVL